MGSPNIDALIARIEGGATDRETADEVLVACGWHRKAEGRFQFWRQPAKRDWEHGDDRPNPLTSLDAAVALVPEDCIWRVFSDWPGDAYFATVTRGGHGTGYEFASVGAVDSPAAALCIALLRAIDSMPRAA